MAVSRQFASASANPTPQTLNGGVTVGADVVGLTVGADAVVVVVVVTVAIVVVVVATVATPSTGLGVGTPVEQISAGIS